MDAPWIEALGKFGLSGIVLFLLLKVVIPKLDRLFSRMGDIGASLCLLIASLPEAKRRTKDEAERLRKQFTSEITDGVE